MIQTINTSKIPISQSPEAEALRGQNALWDDRVLCMPGQNKNLDNSEIDIDSLYTSVIKETNINNNIAPIVIRSDETINKPIASSAHYNLQVYPNPASQFVIISYESQTNGYFRIFNSIGELILETELAAYNTKTQIPLPNIANGIYHYEVDFVAKLKTIGKLSILK
ncbi:MAG: T9SS type A sorting domain-containing protein [Chitinophagaceae bacterium]|nr:T9SS type A sorting domain-containing protein [Chitinophagaceae bacterium]